MINICDVCGSSSNEKFKIIDKHEYRICTKCKTIFLTSRKINLKNNSSNHTYLDSVEDYAVFVNPYGTRYIATNIEHWYKTKVGLQKGKLLEIGAGMGFLAYTLFSRDWEVECIELSDSAIEWQQRNFKLPMKKAMIEDFDGDGYSAIVLVEVLEHIYNPLKGLVKMNTMLNTGGMIFGTTPNTMSDHWKNNEQNIYEPSDHIVLFNKKSLEMILRKAGFVNISVEFFGVGDDNDSNLMYSATKPISLRRKIKSVLKRKLKK